MKFILTTLAIAAASAIVQLFLPWWSLAFVAFIIGYLSKLNGWAAFAAGLLGAGSVWFVYALWLNMGNESLLATKIGVMFGGLPPLALVMVAAVIAGLVGALASAGGRNLKTMLAKG